MREAENPELHIDAILRHTRFGSDADWVEHAPFVFWLFDALQPRVAVDVTRDKCGLTLCICEAAHRSDLCRVHIGPPLAGASGPAWIDTFVGTLPAALIDRVTLHEDGLSGLVAEIGPSTVDLLHIDSVDDPLLEPLLRILSDRAVVVSHEPPTRGASAGRHPTFEFTHAGGLQVSSWGAEPPAAIPRLASLAPEDARLVRALFERLGSTLRIDARLAASEAAEARLAEDVVRLQSAHDDLARERDLLAAAVKVQMEASLANADAARRHEDLLEQVYGSPSWRITRPLRLRTILGKHRGAHEDGGRELPTPGAESEVADRQRPHADPPPNAVHEDALVAEIRASGLVDEEWYLDTYPDVAQSGCDPIQHQLGYMGSLGLGWGGLSGQDPNAWFDCEWYRARYGDSLAPGHTPLLDYLRADPTEERDTSFWFDAGWFRSTSRGLAHPSTPALVQFREAGWPRAMSFPGRLRREPRTKVVFISGLPDHPGNRYRVQDVEAALPPHLFETVILAITEWPDRRWVLTGTDVLWIWRAPLSAELREITSLARSQGARVIVDVDDLVFDDTLTAREVDGIRSQNLDAASQGELARRHFKTMQQSDLVVTPTASLAEEASARGLSAVVLPNGHDATFAARSVRARHRRAHIVGQPFRVGYAAGSRTHQRDLSVASRALATFLSRHQSARLVLFRGSIDLTEFPDLEASRDQIEWRDPVPLEDLPFEYARFDINIAPLEVGNRFCEAKSALKFNESALVGIPTIASPTRPFREVITNGVNGFLAESTEEWLFALEVALTDPVLLASVGERAFQEARWSFGPELRTLRVSHIVRAVLAGDPPRRVGRNPDLNIGRADPSGPNLEVQSDHVGADAPQVSIVLPGTIADAAACVEHLPANRAGTMDLILLERRRPDGPTGQTRDLPEHLARLAIVHTSSDGDWLVGGLSELAAQHVRTPWLLLLPPGAVLAPEGVKRLMQIADATRLAIVAPELLAEGTLSGVPILSAGRLADVALVSTALATRASGVADPEDNVDLALWRALLTALAYPA